MFASLNLASAHLDVFKIVERAAAIINTNIQMLIKLPFSF